jgi:hypothetical protein
MAMTPNHDANTAASTKAGKITSMTMRQGNQSVGMNTKNFDFLEKTEKHRRNNDFDLKNNKAKEGMYNTMQGFNNKTQMSPRANLSATYN